MQKRIAHFSKENFEREFQNRLRNDEMSIQILVSK